MSKLSGEDRQGSTEERRLWIPKAYIAPTWTVLQEGKWVGTMFMGLHYPEAVVVQVVLNAG